MFENPKIYRYVIKDWDKQQHYHTGHKTFQPSMAWFKLHWRKLIADPQFMQLDLDEQWFYVFGLLGIGSQFKGRLPSSKDIAYHLRREHDEEFMKFINETLDKFMSLGLIKDYNPNEDKTLHLEIGYQLLRKHTVGNGMTVTQFQERFKGKELNRECRKHFDKYFGQLDLTTIDVEDILLSIDEDDEVQQVINKDTGEITKSPDYGAKFLKDVGTDETKAFTLWSQLGNNYEEKIALAKWVDDNDMSVPTIMQTEIKQLKDKYLLNV